ncbi:hypothetical protein CR513_02274, partial [Mucuna pruriens]
MEIDLMRAQIVNSREATMAWFLHGLNSEIQDIELVHQATKVELQVKRRQASRKPYSSNSSWKGKEKEKERPRRDKCSKKGKVSPLPISSASKSSSIKCFKCLAKGHIASQCPNRRTMVLKDDGDVDSESSNEDSSSSSGGESSSEGSYNEGDLLIVRRLMSNTIEEENKSQRETIFHSRCLVLRKLCSIIIGGACCVNMDSLRLVEKLALPTLPHPRPYKLQWLSENGELVVDRKVTLAISLGSYTDDILCDIVPMEVVLKPLSPRKVSGDQVKMRRKRKERKSKGQKCQEKTKRETKENKEEKKKERSKGKEKVEGEKSKSASKGKRSLLVGRNEVKRVLLARKKPLLLCPVNMYFHVASPLLNFGFQKILEGYTGIFPKEMPQDLPPLREIEHHTNLTMGAFLPNKPVYKANPEETKENQKQVETLLEKGWVRESKSICIVPIILVPRKDGTWRIHLIPCLNNLLDELYGEWLSPNKGEKGDEWKIYFKTKLGQYEWLVMSFGLTNAPCTFMRLMNHVLRSLICRCVVVYFDDILKYTFYTNEVVFLGFVVGSHKVKVDSEKVKACKFLQMLPPLNEIIKRNMGFKREKSQERAFQALKDRLIHSPILALLKFVKSFELEFDASNELYVEDEDFKETYELCSNLGKGGFFRHEGFLFKDRRLCMPRSSIKEMLVRKAHEGGLMDHFGEVKTYETLVEHFY